MPAGYVSHYLAHLAAIADELDKHDIVAQLSPVTFTIALATKEPAKLRIRVDDTSGEINLIYETDRVGSHIATYDPSHPMVYDALIAKIKDYKDRLESK